MPKRSYSIKDFSGGLINDVSSRDLEPNQLSLATNVDPSSRGKLTNTFKFANDSALDDFGSVNPQIGAGLFVFSNDKAIVDDDPNAEDFILKSSSSTALALQEVTGTDITLTDVLTAATNPVPAAPQFYAAEGDVYIGGDHSAAPVALKYHAQDKFNLNSVNDDWLVSKQARTAPVIHTVGGGTYEDDPTITHTSSSAIVVGQSVTGDGIPAGATVAVITDATHFELSTATTGGAKSGQTLTFRTMNIAETGSTTDVPLGANNISWIVKYGANDTGLWNNDHDASAGTGTYIEFGSSWLYKNEAESTIFELPTGNANDGGMVNAASHENANIAVQAWMSADATEAKLDIYGARLYARQNLESTWYLLAEIDLEKGIKGDGEEDWAGWITGANDFNKGSSPGGYQATSGEIFAPPSLMSYAMKNGHTTGDIVDIVYWKHGVVANSRAYVGNVNINGRSYGDKILKSPVYQYDVFTEKLFIDVASNDGDSITALAVYGDMLLEFKEKSLFLINISKELEYMEDVKQGAGISSAAAMAKTPFGIAWANGNGVYLYDGKEVTQLTMGKISDSTWASFAGSPANMICGYHPGSRQFLVLEDGGDSTNAYVFTFDTGTWHYVNDIISSTSNATNMVNTSDGKLLIGGCTGNTHLLNYEVRSGTSTIDIKTGQLSLGDHETRKNLLSVKVRYKYGDGSLNVSIISNDDADDIGEDSDTLSGALSDTSGNMHTKEYDTSALTNLQGQYWFQIRIHGTAHQSFELDEIVLTYRDLGVR